MMKCKVALVFLVVVAVYLQQSQGTPIAAKKVIAAAVAAKVPVVGSKIGIKAAKVPLVSAKVGIAKSVAAKIKLAAFKKWAAVHAAGKKVALAKVGALTAVAKAPFVLGKKAALAKIGAINAVAAFKVAAGKKVLAVTSAKLAAAAALPKAAAAAAAALKPLAIVATKKVVPVVGAVSALPAATVAALKPFALVASNKVVPLVSAVAALPAAAAAAIPAAAAAAFKPIAAAALPILPSLSSFPSISINSAAKPSVNVLSVPVTENHYQLAQPNAHYHSSYVGSYKDGLDTARSYANGYSVSLLPSKEVSSSYQYYTVPTASHTSYETVVPTVSHTSYVPDTSYTSYVTHHVPVTTSEEHHSSQISSSHEVTEKHINQELPIQDVVVPHDSYGVPN